MKNKKIIYISGAVILLGTLAYFGYKWYTKNKNGAEQIVPKPTLKPHQFIKPTQAPGGVVAPPAATASGR